MSLLRQAGRTLLRGRSYATEAVATKSGLDFGELTSFASSDELKREVGSLKKVVDDMRELLANQSKARTCVDSFIIRTLHMQGRVAVSSRVFCRDP